MSGPSRNESAHSSATGWRRVLLFEPAFRANLLIFFAPPCFLLLEAAVRGGKPFFAIGVFLAGSLLELLIDALLRRRALQGSLRSRRLAWLQYLNHTVLGLPITIYLAASALSPTAALLRLLPVLHVLCRSRSRSQPLIHLALFVTGYLVYAAGLRYAWPGEREIFTVAAGLAFGLLLLERERLGARTRLAAAVARRDSQRARRRSDRVEAREARLLDALLLTPDRVRRHRKDLTIRPAAGEMLCVVVDFPDLHQAVADHARRAREDGVHAGAALADFEHEWDLCVDHYRRGFTEQSLLAPLGDRRIWGLEFLARSAGDPADSGPGAPSGGQGDVISQAGLERRVLELVLAVRALLAFSDRSRRALESRGRRGWSAVAAIAAGEGSLVRRGPANPAPVGRGPVFAELETALQFAVQAKDSGDRAAAMYIQPQLAGVVRRVFAPAGAVDELEANTKKNTGENWFSPGYLRAEYSIKGAGVEPLPDLFERLRYGGAPENEREFRP